jgi:hypothetical protein
MENREISIMEVRRDNLRKIIPQWGGAVALAIKLGHAGAAFVTQMAGPNPTREISEKQARKIESRLDLPRGWLDMNHNVEDSNIVIGLDENRLEISIMEVIKACRDRGVVLSPEKLAKVVRMIYTSDKSALSMTKYAVSIVELST